MSLLNDILKETYNGRTKYSQGRFYLFVSFSAFFLLNIVLGVGTVTNIVFEDQKTLLVVSENLRWALGTFALYVLGGKGIGAFRDSKTGISNDYMHEAPYGGHGGNYGAHGGFYGQPPGGHGFPGGPIHQNPIDPTGNNSGDTSNFYSTSGDDFYMHGDEEVL